MLLSLGQCATLACLLEVAAPKPGNVNRGADFENLSFFDFAASAVAIGPALDSAIGRPPGETVLAALRATRQLVATNTNLGTLLLLAPLAGVPRGEELATGIARIMAQLTPDDARNVYEAIRLAHPGAMGRVPQGDIAEAPPDDLLWAMQLAADRDLVARQYTNGFSEVLGFVAPGLVQGVADGFSLGQAIVHTQLRLMSEFPDSLIARKCGAACAQQSADRAAAVLAAGRAGSEAYQQALAEFDFWLRSDHHRRNPGTSADLIAAGLFVTLREGWIRAPFRL